MNSPPQPHGQVQPDSWRPAEELQALLAALVEGELSPAQQGRLEELLRSDDAARRYYVQMMSLHARLHARFAGVAAAGPAGEARNGKKAQPTRPARQGQMNALAWHAREFFVRPTPLSLSVAAAVIVVMLGIMAAVAPPIYRAVRGAADDVELGGPVFVARITDQFDAQWAPDQVGGHVGAHLVAGQPLELQKGIVEIAFRSGAVVLLEGPASFRIGTPAPHENSLPVAGQFTRGVLTARVPPQARGFTIETPEVKLIDVGTEFAVAARPKATDVIVLQGRVEAYAATAPQAPPSAAVSLVRGDAVRFGRGGSGQPLAAAERQFARHLGAAASDREDGYVQALLADRPLGLWRLNDVRTSLAVNLAGRPHGLFSGGVALASSPPGDEQAAAQFDGESGLVSVPHQPALNSEDFTIEAWVKLDRAPRDYASIVTSRCDKPRLAGYMLYVAPNGELQFWTGAKTAWHQLAGPPLAPGEWTHLAASFQRNATGADGLLEGVKSLYVNGRLAAQDQNAQYLPQTEHSFPLRIAAGASESRQPRYFFPGQIADAALFASALSGDQMQRHFQAAIAAKVAPHEEARGSVQGSGQP